MCRLGWPDGLAFCLALPERAGVVAIPSQGFYDDKEEGAIGAWAICKTEDVIREGLARLAGAGTGSLASGLSQGSSAQNGPGE